jgi:hypothetical protein
MIVVITEAPSSSSGVLTLADFGTVSYSTSSANSTSLASLSPGRDHHDRQQDRDKDTTSSIASGGAITNTWLRSS